MMKVDKSTNTEISMMLAFVFVLLGIRSENIPDENEQTILINHIKTNMSRWSLLDMRTAFELLVTGKLDFDRDHLKKISPDAAYSSKFSSLYLDNVMQSYQRYRFNVVSANKAEVVDVKEEKVTSEQADKIIRQCTIDAFSQFKKSRKVYDFGSPKFNYLRSLGVINFTEGRWAHIREKAKFMIETESLPLFLKSIKPKNYSEKVEEQAKEIALSIFFNDLIETETEITDLI